MVSGGSDESPDPQDHDPETLDREFDESNGELRMIIPGVTVLMAFLLTVPVASGFVGLNRTQQSVCFLALLSTTPAVMSLLGEPACHRLRGKPYDEGRLVKTVGRQMTTALVLLPRDWVRWYFSFFRPRPRPSRLDSGHHHRVDRHNAHLVRAAAPASTRQRNSGAPTS